MLLIAGGQFDKNITALVARLQVRDIPHYALLIGPGDEPRLRIDLEAETLQLNGETITPTGCFIRQDVFLYQTPDMNRAQVRAQNWYAAIRGWIEASPGTRLFNRQTTLRENSKVANLMAARQCGLRVPKTIVTNDLTAFTADADRLIEKPVAGGEYTAMLTDAISTGGAGPRFVQPRFDRPEYRIYRVGPTLIAFELLSDELDYRRTQQVTLTQVPVPVAVAGPLVRLCDRLDLDFAAADFMLDGDGRMTFLEVNTQPMFAAFDRAAGGGLCDAIIDALTGADADRRIAHGDRPRVAYG